MRLARYLCLLPVFLLTVITVGYAQQASSVLFIENKGQWPDEVAYFADIPGGQLFVRSNKLTFSFYDEDQMMVAKHQHPGTSQVNGKIQDSESQIDFYAIDLDFIGSNEGSEIKATEASVTQYNYFLGNDQSKWVQAAKAYHRLELTNVYDGVNLMLYADQTGLKYDLILDPGVPLDIIKMKYNGAENISLKEGKLTVETPIQTFHEVMPLSYVKRGEQKKKIDSHYVLDADIISFSASERSIQEKLVIDPLLVFSTYSGSAADNWGNTATYDDAGNAYSGGMTNHYRGEFIGEFPATPGAYQTEYGGIWDVGILKFDSAGTELLYATYLGGSGSEVPQSLIVNEQGELLILGITGSANFPTSENAYDKTYNGGTDFDLIGGVPMSGSDIFIAKLSADGSQLISSTFLGGTLNDGMLPVNSILNRNYGDESRGDIAFDQAGNVIIVSRTLSTDFPTVSAVQESHGGDVDAVVVKLSHDLSDITFSTYLGGSAADVALALKIDQDNNLFVAGGTSSVDFPTTAGAESEAYLGDRDGWVTHMMGTGDSLIASTYLGTSSYDQAFFMDLDDEENVYIAGQTTGQMTISDGVYNSGTSGQFIQKLGHALDTILFSTVINTPGRVDPAISLTAFLVNDCNNMYLSGWGSNNGTFTRAPAHFRLGTQGLPVTADAYQPTTDGSAFYLMVLTGDASELLYATFLGDANSLVHVDGGTSRFDKNGIVYHSVCASCFGDSSFPTTEGAYSVVNGSSGCNNAVFKFDLASLRARIQTNNITLDEPGYNQGCIELEVVFQNLSTGGELFEWDFGDGTTVTTTDKIDVLHSFPEAGVYNVTLRASDPNTCIAEDFAYTTVVASSSDFRMSPSTNLCAGEILQLEASGGDVYSWFPAEGLDIPDIASPRASPQDTIQYTLTIQSKNGCFFKDSITVNVIPKVEVSISVEQSKLCEGSQEVKVLNESSPLTSVAWDFGDGYLTEDLEPVHAYETDGNYILKGRLDNSGCAEDISVDVVILDMFIPNVITRNADGFNDVFKIQSPYPVDLNVYNRWGETVFTQGNYQNDWDGNGLSTGIYYYETILPSKEVCNGWLQIFDGNEDN